MTVHDEAVCLAAPLARRRERLRDDSRAVGAAPPPAASRSSASTSASAALSSARPRTSAKMKMDVDRRSAGPYAPVRSRALPMDHAVHMVALSANMFPLRLLNMVGRFTAKAARKIHRMKRTQII